MPCCRSASIESFRLLPAIQDSALPVVAHPVGMLVGTTASADSSVSVPAVSSRVVRFARTDAEASQGKSCHRRSALAGFTHTHVRMTTGPPRPWPGYPTVQALYPVSVRRVRVLLSASFRFRLTADTLAWPSGSGHHGPQRSFTPWLHDMPGIPRLRQEMIIALPQITHGGTPRSAALRTDHPKASATQNNDGHPSPASGLTSRQG